MDEGAGLRWSGGRDKDSTSLSQCVTLWRRCHSSSPHWCWRHPGWRHWCSRWCSAGRTWNTEPEELPGRTMMARLQNRHVILLLLLGFSRSDVKRRSRWTQRFGEKIHPHRQTALRDSSHSQSGGRLAIIEGYWLAWWTLISTDDWQPAVCRAVLDWTDVWFPHVQEPKWVSSGCGERGVLLTDPDDVGTPPCHLSKRTHTQTHTELSTCVKKV